MKEQNNIMPLYSHLVKFDKPKIVFVGGFVFDMRAMLMSSVYDAKNNINTTLRTILSGETLEPAWHLNSDKDSSIYELKHFPYLTREDIRRIIRGTIGVRPLADVFEELQSFGYRYVGQGEDVQFSVQDACNKWSLCGEIGAIANLGSGWIPEALTELYSIQKFLKLHAVLVPAEYSGASEDTLKFMNQILENQFKNGIWCNCLYDERKALNDGVCTYYKTGISESMSREEFLKKFPTAMEMD